MQIKDLKPKMGKIDITADVVEKSAPRTFDKFGKAGQVCDAKIRDESGEVKLTLWNDQVGQVSVGDKVKITNGYADEFRGTMQLSTGKFGTLEVVGKATPGEPKSSPVNDAVDKMSEDEFGLEDLDGDE